MLNTVKQQVLDATGFVLPDAYLMRTILVTVFVILGCQGDAYAADALYRREVNDKNPGGKDLVMTLQELRRDEKTSDCQGEIRLWRLRPFGHVHRARSLRYRSRTQN